MAWDPKTGKWTDEDTGVASRVTALTSKDDPYMQQAETEGLKQANRRGLVNSSIAVGAVEDARIRAALPIASQEASQANQREMQGRGLQSSEVLQEREIAGSERMQTRGLETQERMQGKDIASREGLARQDIASRERMLGTELGSRERIAGQEITSREGMQRTEIAANQWLAQFDASTRERLQGLDAQTRLELQRRDNELQERLSDKNIAVEERANASRIATSFELAYQSFLASIINNADIPADVRQQYFDQANRMRDSNYALVEQLFGIDLDWATAGP